MATDAHRPPAWAVAACAAGSGLSMIAAVYFGGQGQLPVAMTGSALFGTARRPGIRPGTPPLELTGDPQRSPPPKPKAQSHKDP